MDGYIYLVNAVSTDRYKIGFTTLEPRHRINRLQTGSAFRLKLIHYFKGSREDENRLHRHFENYSCGGEWFKFKSLAHVLKHFEDAPTPVTWKIKEHGVWDRDKVAIAVGSQWRSRVSEIPLNKARVREVRNGKAKEFWYTVVDRLELPDTEPTLTVEQIDQIAEWYFHR